VSQSSQQDINTDHFSSTAALQWPVLTYLVSSSPPPQLLLLTPFPPHPVYPPTPPPTQPPPHPPYPPPAFLPGVSQYQDINLKPFTQNS